MADTKPDDPFQVEIDSQLKVQQQLIRLNQLSKQFTQVESQIRVLTIGRNILSLGIENQQVNCRVEGWPS